MILNICKYFLRVLEGNSGLLLKQKLNLATWWRHFSGQSIKIAFSTTKMAQPGGEIKFWFNRRKPISCSITCKKIADLYPSGEL